MARRNVRDAALMATTRVNGSRWSIAMRDAEWECFVVVVDPEARARLTVVMEHFCDHGERDLPRGAFRWLSRGDDVRPSARNGALEARGVVLRGHASDSAFFVTSVEIDPVFPSRPVRRRRSARDDGQPLLPLLFIAPTGDDDG